MKLSTLLREALHYDVPLPKSPMLQTDTPTEYKYICIIVIAGILLVISQGTAIADSLRELKSQIEGTHFAFQPFSLDSSELVQLKHLVTSHTPDNLNDVTRAKITEKLASILGGQVKRLLYACLLTCPWFAHSQSKGSSQAKNTLLYVVFVSRDEQFFSLATNHEKKLSDCIDEVSRYRDWDKDYRV